MTKCECYVSWGRTGTDSFREAMNILYKDDKSVGKSGACYHMRGCMQNKHASFWTKFSDSRCEGKPDIAALREMFIKLGFKASCDWPSSPYWKEQLEAFPNAKVVLAIRFVTSVHWILLFPLIHLCDRSSTLGIRNDGTKVLSIRLGI